MKENKKKKVSLVVETDEPSRFYCPSTVGLRVNFGENLPEAAYGEYNLPMRYYPEIRRVVRKVERGQNLFTVLKQGMGAESPFRRQVCHWLDEALRNQLFVQAQRWIPYYEARAFAREVWFHPYFVRQ